MKARIAIASDDGKSISEHFGRAAGFAVYDVSEQGLVQQGYRSNAGKSTGECGSCNHATMVENVKDCGFVISHGMGKRIYDDLMAAKVVPIVTDERSVEAAANAFKEGRLVNRLDRLH